MSNATAAGVSVATYKDGDMPYKFKIGDIVYYRPNDRMLSTARGTYTVIGRMPAGGDQQPEYRIKHFSEGFERVALESELSASEPEHGQRDDPRAPYKVYKGDELKGTYPTRAEARRAQQRLESQAAGSEPQRNFVIMDCLGRVVI
jgi:hypothetical protein